jgi:hypothetical protein
LRHCRSILGFVQPVPYIDDPHALSSSGDAKWSLHSFCIHHPLQLFSHLKERQLLLPHINPIGTNNR